MSSPAENYPSYEDLEKAQADIARVIAGNYFNRYLFDGILPSGNYVALRLTSHRFDELRCLDLLAQCDHVISMHGCRGEAQHALVGGLDEPLKAAVAQAIWAPSIDTRIEDHQFPATEPKNICNRGRRGVGVQVEMTMPLRSHGPREALAAAIRSVLLALPETNSCSSR